MLYVANIDEKSLPEGNTYSQLGVEKATEEGAEAIVLCAALEAQIAQMPPDMERGFIRAEVISYEDFMRYGGEEGAKAAGRLFLRGREDEMREGDVVYFRFAV